VSFGLIALLTSLFAGVATYSFSRSSLIDQRYEATRAQALGNAQLMRTLLQTRRNMAGDLIGTVRTDSRGYALIRVDPQNFFYATDPLSFTQSDLPESLVASVAEGRAATQRFDHDGELYQGYGIPLPSVGADYYEVFPLRETQRTLSFILSALLAGLIVATATAIALGWFTSRRLLAPVRRVADTAADIAGGRLDARLDPEDDPDLNRLAVTFNEMADAVQERIEREVRFASDVSHELRSPITALSAAVDVLAARRSELSERNQQALDVLATQVKRFDRMVIDLLELSRLDSGSSAVRYESVDINDIVRRIAQRSGFGAVPIVASGIVHETEVTDRLRFERILVNLLVNAREHAGGPNAIVIEGHIDSITLTVVDEGPGLPEAERQRIFNRFARGSSAARGTGTGLGLSIALEHALALGGGIRISDNQPQGLRFSFDFPVEPDTVVDVAE
jgi:signal transduction histidine kinase